MRSPRLQFDLLEGGAVFAVVAGAAEPNEKPAAVAAVVGAVELPPSANIAGPAVVVVPVAVAAGVARFLSETTISSPSVESREEWGISCCCFKSGS